jgi:hypothetical protein
MQPAPIKHVVIPPESLFQPLGDEAVVLSIASGQYYGLNETAKRIWELLAEYGDPEKVVERMLLEFEVDERTLRSDIECLIAEFQQARLAQSEK